MGLALALRKDEQPAQFATLPSGYRRNAALASLPPQALTLVERHLREATWSAGRSLWTAGEPCERVYFPLTGIIKVEQPVAGHAGVAVALVGRDAACGAIGDLDPGQRSATGGVMLTEGSVAHVSAAAFAALARTHAAIAGLERTAGRWLLTQARSIAACCCAHTLPHRIAGLLLQMADRAGDAELRLTQEEIAYAIGARRITVTIIMQHLGADLGAISYRRGKVRIRERDHLQLKACGCYASLAPECWPFATPLHPTEAK
jgi:CRP-like cAMP-binding protein